jgi:hypothetical protein
MAKVVSTLFISLDGVAEIDQAWHFAAVHCRHPLIAQVDSNGPGRTLPPGTCQAKADARHDRRRTHVDELIEPGGQGVGGSSPVVPTVISGSVRR